MNKYIYVVLGALLIGCLYFVPTRKAKPKESLKTSEFGMPYKVEFCGDDTLMLCNPKDTFKIAFTEAHVLGVNVVYVIRE